MAKKIGYSLSNCLRSIVADKVPLDDVVFITTSTAYADRESMIAALRTAMAGPDLARHIENACVLWDTGRLFQPSVRPLQRRPVDILWRAALPEEVAMDAEVATYTVHKSQGGTWDDMIATDAATRAAMVETAILRTTGPTRDRNGATRAE